jgi:hypothetical protein
MKHVNTLKEEWARYCGSKHLRNREKTQALKKKIGVLDIEIPLSIRRMECVDVEIKEEEREIAQKQLDELLPMSFEMYALKEFSKDFKTSTKAHELTDQDRLFFRIYYYRQYLGATIKVIQQKFGFSAPTYYKIYREGMERFFPEDKTEELSEVG